MQCVLIVGAGEAGQLVVRMIRESFSPHTYQLLGYLDDDPVKIGRVVMGIKVLGRCDPGEKLHEELALEKEMRSETPHPRISRLCQKPTLSDTDTLRALYNELLHVHAHTDDSIMRKLLRLYLQAAEAGHSSLSTVNTPALNEPTRMLITQWVESHMLYRRQD